MFVLLVVICGKKQIARQRSAQRIKILIYLQRKEFTAPKEKYIPYDDRAERWVKRAVAAHVMYPDEEGADLRAENSALSSHIRFALVGLLGDIEKE